MKTNSKSSTRANGALVAQASDMAKAQNSLAGGALARIVALVAADPARAVAVSLLSTVLVSVSVNALYLQNMKHPSPLFDPTPPLPDTALPVLENAPMPVPRSTAFSSALADVDISTLDTGFTRGPAPAMPMVPANTGSGGQKPDSIGDLINSGGVKLTPPAPNRTVLSAQRALSKLGYAVRPDGVNGGTTRQAIERFERDNRLPVKGDLTPKLMRELSMAAGMPVE